MNPWRWKLPHGALMDSCWPLWIPMRELASGSPVTISRAGGRLPRPIWVGKQSSWVGNKLVWAETCKETLGKPANFRRTPANCGGKAANLCWKPARKKTHPSTIWKAILHPAESHELRRSDQTRGQTSIQSESSMDRYHPLLTQINLSITWQPQASLVINHSQQP